MEDLLDRITVDADGSSLAGLARWEGAVLRFTDPNGTAPYGAEDLADVYARALPPGVPACQRDAMLG